MKHLPPVKKKQKTKLRSPDRGSSLLEGEEMDNDIAVMSLAEFLYETGEPEVYWPQHEFDEVSFNRWAAGELMEAIMDNPTVPAMDTIEEFAIKMTSYWASAGECTKAEKIFKYAADFAYETLDIFREELANT